MPSLFCFFIFWSSLAFWYIRKRKREDQMSIKMDFSFSPESRVGSRGPGRKEEQPDKIKKETNMTKMPTFWFYPIEKCSWSVTNRCLIRSTEGIKVLLENFPECNKWNGARVERKDRKRTSVYESRALGGSLCPPSERRKLYWREKSKSEMEIEGKSLSLAS